MNNICLNKLAFRITITHKKITEPNFIVFELFSGIRALWLPNRFVSGTNGSRYVVWAQDYRIELLWKLYSVILVEEFPNRNCFGINSVIFLCMIRVQTRGLLEKGSSQQSPFLEILENLEILEILVNPQTLENKISIALADSLSNPCRHGWLVDMPWAVPRFSSGMYQKKSDSSIQQTC